MTKKVEIFIFSLFCHLVKSGSDDNVERVYHPNVESRDLGPLMESGLQSRYSVNSGYSPQGGYQFYGCPTCRQNPRAHSPGFQSSRSSFSSSSSFNSESPVLNQPNRASSYQYEKREKENFVNGQQVYDLHHEKEYRDGRLVNEHHLEKTPEDFGIPSSYDSSTRYTSNGKTAPKYSTGLSSSSTHQQYSSSSATRPKVSISYSPQESRTSSSSSSSSSRSTSGSNSQHAMNNFHDDAHMQSEMQKLREELERKTLSLHQDSSHTRPRYGSHRTEYKTQVKYVNGKRVYEKNEEKKYRNGELIHDEIKETGEKNAGHDFLSIPNERVNTNKYHQYSTTQNRPYYVKYPSSYGTESNYNTNYKPTSQYSSSSLNQYNSNPYYTSSYPKSSIGYGGSSTISQTKSTELQSSSSGYPISTKHINVDNIQSGSSPRYLVGSTGRDSLQNVKYFPNRAYGTETKEDLKETTPTNIHQNSYFPRRENTNEETRRYSTSIVNNNYPGSSNSRPIHLSPIQRPSSSSSSNYGSSSSWYQTSENSRNLPNPGTNNYFVSRQQRPMSTVVPTTSTPVPNINIYKKSSEKSQQDYTQTDSRPSSSSYYQQSWYSSEPKTYIPSRKYHNSYQKSQSQVPDIYSSRTYSNQENKQYLSSRGSSDEHLIKTESDLRSSNNDNHLSSPSDGSDEETDSSAILPGVISGPPVERGDQLSNQERERYDISPLIDGAEPDTQNKPNLKAPLYSIKNYPHSSYYTNDDERKNSNIKPGDYSQTTSVSSSENQYRTTVVPSNRVEAKTTRNYINGKLAKEIIIYKYYEGNVLIDQNSSIKTRDELASEGLDVYALDLSNIDLLSYGPRDQSIHSQKHEVTLVQKFRNGFPIYELNEVGNYQDNVLVHSTREEKNEDDFINANRLLIESQNRNNYFNSEKRFNTRPQGYAKKSEYHEEEEFINGKKVYHHYHEKEFHNGNLVHENKSTEGTKNLGGWTVDQGGINGGAMQSQSSNTGHDMSQHSLVTGCLTCGPSNNLLLQSGSQTMQGGSSRYPQGHQMIKTFRHDKNVEEHYQNGRLLKGVEDNKKWDTGVLTDANTEHYYAGPSRINTQLFNSNYGYGGGSHRQVQESSSLNNRDRLIHVSQERGDDCASNPCINGGTCKKSRHNLVCICPFGFKGSRCEEAYCPSRYCRYGGMCSISTEGQHDCECLEGFTGHRCTTKIYKMSVRPSG